jgi:ABC-type nitrate/sulfonate/bicarbonate transport system substrate-binding protein
MLNLGVSGVLDVKVIAVWANRLLLSFVVRNDIRTPSDLKRKRIGISRFGSFSDLTTRMLLKHWQIDPDKDVTILQAGGNNPTRIAALAAGRIDAAIIGMHDVARVVELGCCSVLADLDELPLEYASFGVVVPTSFLKSRRDVLRGFMQVLTEGLYVYKTRPDMVLPLLRQEGVRDPLAVYTKAARAILENPMPETPGVQAALESLRNPNGGKLDANNFIDAGLLQELQNSGQIKRVSK